MLDIGTTVELSPGGHVTPLAQDTLASRRVTVDLGRLRRHVEGWRTWCRSRTSAGWRSAAIIPALQLKRALVAHLRGRGIAVEDAGTDTTEPVDYPDVAGAVATSVARKEADAGIVIDGAGIGSAIAANKVRGIRAVMCTTETIARYSREHNGANVITLGSSLLDAPEAASASSIPGSARRCGRRDTSGAFSRSSGWRSGSATAMQPSERSVLDPHDLQRLIDIITDEVLRAQPATAGAPQRCAVPSLPSQTAAPTACAA